MLRRTLRSGLIARLQKAGLEQIPAMMLAAGVYPFSAKELRKLGPAAAEYGDFSGPSAEARKELATQVAENYLARSITKSDVVAYLASRDAQRDAQEPRTPPGDDATGGRSRADGSMTSITSDSARACPSCGEVFAFVDRVCPSCGLRVRDLFLVKGVYEQMVHEGSAPALDSLDPDDRAPQFVSVLMLPDEEFKELVQRMELRRHGELYWSEEVGGRPRHPDLRPRSGLPLPNTRGVPEPDGEVDL